MHSMAPAPANSHISKLAQNIIPEKQAFGFNSIHFFNRDVQFWNWKGHDRKGLDLWTNSPLSGRGRLFSLVSTRCLYYVLSSLILTFCKYFWISLLTVWRMRRIRSHLILSETMQISPTLPPPKSHQISLSRRTSESQLCGESPSDCTFAAELEWDLCWTHRRCQSPRGWHTHTCPMCPGHRSWTLGRCQNGIMAITGH